MIKPDLKTKLEAEGWLFWNLGSNWFEAHYVVKDLTAIVLADRSWIVMHFLGEQYIYGRGQCQTYEGCFAEAKAVAECEELRLQQLIG